jgi:hypothetical protein
VAFRPAGACSIATERSRWGIGAVIAVSAVVLLAACSTGSRHDSLSVLSTTTTTTTSPSASRTSTTGSGSTAAPGDALAVLDTLAVKGRAAKTGYDRSQFGSAWSDVDHNGCDTRNDILNRDLTDKQWRAGTHDCVVVAGTIVDPYTGRRIQFEKAHAIAVQIDHVVALSDAWQKGAQALSPAERLQLANDPVNLLAVDGPTNESKGDSDAASWLPPNKSFRCAYAARQIAAKAKYRLWVTPAERDALTRVLARCPDERIPG